MKVNDFFCERLAGYAIRVRWPWVKVGTKVVKFPKSNAAKVIPAYGKKFECNLM